MENREPQSAMNTLVGKLARVSPLRSMECFAITATLFTLNHLCDCGLLSTFGRLVFGFVSLLVIPGTMAVQYLPPRLRGSDMGICMGLVVVLAQILVLWNLALLTGLQIPLLAGMLSGTSLVVLTTGVHLQRHRAQEHISYLPTIRDSYWLYVALLVGLLLRAALMVIAQGAIAPDAALYSSYAREMQNGHFMVPVHNDGAVKELWNGVEYISHQGLVFLFAFSWLLLPPSVSGPTFVLLIAGTLLLLPTATIIRNHFGKDCENWIASVIALHPLFIYHSAIGYGPEITSLLFSAFAFVVSCESWKRSNAGLLVTGVTLGFINEIWYTTFYILCLIFPLLIWYFAGLSRQNGALLQVCMMVVLTVRVLQPITTVFITCWSMLFVSLLVLRRKNALDCNDFGGLIAFLGGILISSVAWQWPAYLRNCAQATGNHSPGVGQLINVLNTSPLDVAPQFVFLLLFHTGFFVILGAAVALTVPTLRRTTAVLLLAGLLTSAGTMTVLSSITGSLQYYYLYSDSRFFLFIVFMFCLGSAPFGLVLHQFLQELTLREMKRLPRHRTKLGSAIILSILALSFVPSCVPIPAGIDLVMIEHRYGWHSLNNMIRGVPTDGDRFLVERAREFSWVTGREAVTFGFEKQGLPDHEAAQVIAHLQQQYNARYLLIDSYAVMQWRTLEWLYYDWMPVGSTVLLNMSALRSIKDKTMTDPLLSLTLVATSQDAETGKRVRLFEFTSATYARVSTIDMLAQGWTASNGGSIVNVNGTPQLQIGTQSDYTNTHWIGEGGLGMSIGTGFILMQLMNISSRVTSVELWDDRGELLRCAMRLEDQVYYCSVGSVTIGDIRIKIEGSPGGYTLIESISIWERG